MKGFFLMGKKVIFCSMSPKILLSPKKIDIILNRLACQLIEKYSDFSQVILVGLQPRGILLDRIC